MLVHGPDLGLVPLRGGEAREVALAGVGGGPGVGGGGGDLKEKIRVFLVEIVEKMRICQ